MKLSWLDHITSIEAHPNADRLELATVSNFKCIVPKGVFQTGELVVFISPDTILPDDEWAITFKKYCPTRVRAIKLRGVYSFGLVIKLSVFGDIFPQEAGLDVSGVLKVIKYEAPVPQDLSAKGNLPFGIFKTDEDRWQVVNLESFLGRSGVITLKIDGKSSTYYCKKMGDEWHTGVCSRSLEIKPDVSNQYTLINKKYGILDTLLAYCKANDRSLAVRGEISGQNIQNFAKNPHAKGELKWHMFRILDLDTLKYLNFDEVEALAVQLDFPLVPIIERSVISMDLIKYYAEGIDKLNGDSFEGVVVNVGTDSFKVINLAYDSEK